MRKLILVFIAVLLPLGVVAGPASYFDVPDTAYASNVVIDIIEHNGGVWFATGNGVNFSYDEGLNWLLYDSKNGLISDDVSAMLSLNGRFWVATNHEEPLPGGGGYYTFSDGCSYTDDGGNTWNRIDFGSSGLDIPWVWGADRTIYDMTGMRDRQGRDWVFFTAFAGGFLVSQDGGISWRRIFAAPRDSLNFERTRAGQDTLYWSNRQFSCVADTSHGDSVFVWSGSAAGVHQRIFAVPARKLYSDRINNAALCSGCSAGSTTMFLAGDRGVTKGKITGGPFITRFESDGLPGSYTTAVYQFGGRLFAGTADSAAGASTGLAYSDDLGDSFIADTLSAVVGTGRQILDFAVMRDRLYMAAEEAGLFVSLDTGKTWQHIFVDSADTTPADRRNVVRALDVLADTLRAGGDSGLVTLYLSPTGSIDSSMFHVFPENLSSGGRVIRVRTQRYGYNPADSTYDSLAVWTCNRPQASGTSMVGRSRNGATWINLQPSAVMYDVGFIGDSAFVVGEDGIRFTRTGQNPTLTLQVTDSTTAVRFDLDTVLSMMVFGDTVIFTSKHGLAISPTRAQNFKVFRGNLDSLGADVVVNYTQINTINPDSGGFFTYGLTGNFVPALAMQYRNDGSSWLWASGRPTGSSGEITGMSVARYVVARDTLGDSIGMKLRWDAVNEQEFAWNFAFNGDTAFAATNSGLLMYNDTGVTIAWDTIPFVDSTGRVLVSPDQAVYAVRVVDNTIWVGTDNGTVAIAVNDFTNQRVYGVVDSSDETYAYPVPISIKQGQRAGFHFVVNSPTGADVTIEIYDFAMNLVKRVFENRFYPQGTYQGFYSGVPEWDGRNGRDQAVAVGVYYFKVLYSSGETRWGKLAVIP
ncbi:MAG: hypothetical protein AB1644_03270 [Candidatus Zixiibacteriota bacterium]